MFLLPSRLQRPVNGTERQLERKSQISFSISDRTLLRFLFPFFFLSPDFHYKVKLIEHENWVEIKKEAKHFLHAVPANERAWNVDVLALLLCHNIILALSLYIALTNNWNVIEQIIKLD
jgi:hypothetical protein